MRRVLRLTLGFLLLLPVLAGAQSFPRDDQGVPAAPCYYEQPAGTFNRCSETTPLPVTTLGGGGVEITDPALTATSSGYGKLWRRLDLNSSGAEDGDPVALPVLVASNDIVLLSRDNSNQAATFRTTNAGITWSRVATSTTFTFASDFLLNGFFDATTGQVFVLRGNNTREVRRTRDFITWAQVQNLGTTANGPLSSEGMAVQGNTVLAVGTGAASSTRLCRSATLAADASFTCVDLTAAFSVPPFRGVLGAAPGGAGAVLATPAASIWLLIIGGNLTNPAEIWRSSDDGVTWASVFTAAANQGFGAEGAITCLSATVCLAADYASVYRSTDAGATWTTAITTSTACCYGFVNFGSGVVAGLSRRDIQTGFLLSEDSGATWAGAAGDATADVAEDGGTNMKRGAPTGVAVSVGGWAVVGTATGDSQTDNNVLTTRPIRPTEQVGAQGLPFGQDVTTGNLIVDQGAGAALTAPWTVRLSDGTVAFGTATVPVRTDPTGTTTQPVSGTVTANAGTGTFTVGGTVTATQGAEAAVADSWRFRLADGTNDAAALFDADTGAGTQFLQGLLLRRSGAGGSVEMGTPTEPVRTDPTGTTTQPVSGTVTANAGTGTFTTDPSDRAARVLGRTFVRNPGDTANMGDATTPVRVDPTGTTTQPVSGTVTSNQGTAAAITAPWPVQLSDGAAAQGTAANPVRTDPTGTTAQPVSGTVTANAGAGTFTVGGTVTANQGTAAAGTSAWPVSPIQGATLFNSVTTGAANTAVVVTIAAAASTRAHLYGVDARCSAGTATLDVDDGATGIWDSAAAEVTTTTLRITWTTALTGTTNTAMTITLGPCGVGNTGTLIVQGDRY